MTIYVGHSSSYDPDVVCAGRINYLHSRLLTACVPYCMWHKLGKSLGMRLGGIIPVYRVYFTHFELQFESCFYLMYVFECTTAGCEAGVVVLS